MDPCKNGKPEFFGQEIRDKKVQDWLKAGSKHPVYQAELLPVVAAICTWRAVLRDRELLRFIDNEAARHALVKGYSPILSAAKLLGEAWLAIAEVGTAVWVARVPSGSNPADAPSRLQDCPGWRQV